MSEPAPGEPAAPDLAAVDSAVIGCRRCPRLVAWREDVVATRRKAYAGEEYWARPLPGFGDAAAAVLVLGLAPAAHGGNRTGRVFTGDRSGDWLFAALHRAGFANQPASTHLDDGLALIGCRVVAAVRCAPPDNRPTPTERDTCGDWLDAELRAMPSVRVVVALGAFAWDAGLRSLARSGWLRQAPRPRFGHGAEVTLSPRDPATAHPVVLLGSYHVSQQNTFTGRLTEQMLDDVVGRARRIAETAPG